MINQFTTITDAMNWLADGAVGQLTIEGAQWVYENTDCPAWDAPEFTEYDFLADPKLADIPDELVG